MGQKGITKEIKQDVSKHSLVLAELGATLRAHQCAVGCFLTSSSLYHAPMMEPELLRETRCTLLRRSGSSAVAVVPLNGP